jgi:hypothetical protein
VCKSRSWRRRFSIISSMHNVRVRPLYLFVAIEEGYLMLSFLKQKQMSLKFRNLRRESKKFLIHLENPFKKKSLLTILGL